MDYTYVKKNKRSIRKTADENIKYNVLIANEKKQPVKFISGIEEIADVRFVEKIQDTLRYLTRYTFHLIVLASIQSDIEDICEIIKIIRMLKKVPIVILINENIEKKELFIEAGADIVLSDECEKENTKLQIIALMRRYSEWETDNNKRSEIIQIGPFTINFPMRKVFWNEYELKFTKREFDFLYLLASSPERVYTFEQIYQVVWGDYPDTNIANMIWCMVKRICSFHMSS